LLEQDEIRSSRVSGTGPASFTRKAGMDGRRIVSRTRILVMDDDVESQILSCELLKSAGYEAVGVSSALGVARALATSPAMVVMCDISRSASFHDALESVRGLRAITESRSPIVVTGRHPSGQLSILARACRAAGWLTKPLR